MRYFLLFIFAFFVFDAFSQRNVSGRVFELRDSVKVPATVTIVTEVGTENRVITDSDGKFNITTLRNTASLRFSSLGSLSDTIEITQDTTLNIVLEEDAIMIGGLGCLCVRPIRRISVGANYDFANSMLGLSFGNGFDESPIVRIPSKFVYKINAQTNFDTDYSFGANLAWNRLHRLHLFKQRLWLEAAIGFQQYDLSSQDFFHRDIYTSIFVRSRLPMQLTFKTGHQTLNDFNNWGGNIGFQRDFRYFLSRGNLFFGYYGASVGYYFDYFTYSAYIRGQITWNLHYRITYDRIDNHDFFNVGLSYLFIRRRR